MPEKKKCSDCGTPEGHLHELYCDMERCPYTKVLRQLTKDEVVLDEDENFIWIGTNVVAFQGVENKLNGPKPSFPSNFWQKEYENFPFDFLKDIDISASEEEMEEARKHGERFVLRDPASDMAVVGYNYLGKIWVERVEEKFLNSVSEFLSNLQKGLLTLRF